jgi:nucleotide-binding universal stress UspA family protein
MSVKMILIAYDGSKEGRAALLQSEHLVPLQDAELHLLAVVRLPSGLFLAEGYVPENVMTEEGRRTQEIIDEGVRLLSERNYRVTGHLAFGDPVKEICRVAAELKADLIIIGHRRQSAFGSRWWKSSVGQSLLEQLPCSILITITD